MRRFAILTVCVVVVLFMQLCACAGPVNWISDLSGNWNDAANWSCAPFMPSIWDDVVISRPGILSINFTGGDYIVNSIYCDETFAVKGGSLTFAALSAFTQGLNLEGGSLVTEGRANCSGVSTWIGGKLSGFGGLANMGTLNVQTSGAKYLENSTLDNFGISTITGPLTLANGALFDNHANALVNVQNSGAFYGKSAVDGQINNSGIFRLSNTPPYLDIAVPFNNTGGDN